ncbi:MAG: AtpZ/AtpI family protein [Pseudomonadota bacterium]
MLKAAIDIVAGVLTGLAIGFYADKFFSTKPLLLIIFMCIGFSAGLRNATRIARGKENEDKEVI